MSALSGSWRASLRMARRSVLRSKGRSILIAVMVGTPVLLSVALATTIATNQVSAAEDVPAQMGSAQAVAEYLGGKVEQSPDASNISWTRNDRSDVAGGAARLTDLTGARVLPVVGGSAVVEAGGGAAIADTQTAEWSDPATDGLVTITAGRLPADTGEVLVTPALADQGLTPGSTLRTRAGDAFAVVGVGTYGSVAPEPALRAVVGVPGAFGEHRSDVASYLVDRSEAVTWADVQQLNTAGFQVVSRAVLADPPPAPEQYADVGGSGTAAADAAIIALIVTSVVIEIILIAGPAFAVGVRRQRRELALVAATGGTPRDIRRVVLAQALVLGAGASVLGAVLGVGFAAVLVRVLPRWFPVAFGPFDVPWTAVAVAAAIGALASMVAAYAPARQAARQEVSAVLAGRAGQLRVRRGWPVLGAVLAAGGIAGCLTLGRQPGGEWAVAVSTIVLVVGAVFLIPVVIGVVATIGSWLPLPLRLALRDTARQRARSAPAIAAVMAAVAGITTLAIATASDDRQGQETYEYQYPEGTAVIGAGIGKESAAIRAAVQEVLPGRSLVELSTADLPRRSGAVSLVGDPCRTCSWYGGPIQQFDYPVGGTIAVADPTTLAAWGVTLDRRQRTALNAGGILVGGEQLVADDGTAALRLSDRTNGPDGRRDTRTVRLPATGADLHLGVVPRGAEPMVAHAVISSATARDKDIPTTVTTLLVDRVGGAGVSQEQETALTDAVTGAAPSRGYVDVERGYHSAYGLLFALLAGLGGMAVLIGTLSATGLALSDARPDFATLAAVGAAPRTRRLMAAAQAVVLGLLGSLVGVAVGFAPGIAATWPLTAESYNGDGHQGPYIAIPWGIFAIVVVAVPLVAALASAAFTRSRLPIVRRLAQ